MRARSLLVLMALLLASWARIGLEDTLLLPDGRLAPDNAALVATARDML